MTDLVERLRDTVRDSWDEQVMDEAADEIERNRAAIAELVEVLDAAETMLRCFHETSTNAFGTKPMMTTTRALKLVRAAITKHSTTEK